MVAVVTRTAVSADLGFLADLDTHLSAERLAQCVRDGRVLVAEADGERVGLLRWNLFWDLVPFMNLLFVSADRRGQTVGTTLVTTWEQERRSAGHRMVLTSTSAAETAQHFYRKLGYVECGNLLLPDEPTELLFRKAFVD